MRRTRQPRPLINPLATAIQRSRPLSLADRVRQATAMDHALSEFVAGRDCARHWCSLADTANMTETLSGMGLARGAEAADWIRRAQQALADVQLRHAAGGTWTLYPTELQDLRDLLKLHRLQLAVVSYGEMDRAYTTTARRMAGALAGSPPKGAHVIVGQICTEGAGS